MDKAKGREKKSIESIDEAIVISSDPLGGVLNLLSGVILDASSFSEMQKLRLECCIASMYDDQLNCSICLDKFSSSPEFRRKKGCFGDMDHSNQHDSGWETYICPGRLFDTFELELVKDYQRLRDYSLLPTKGAVGDQPAWWVDAMDYIREETYRWEKKNADKGLRDQKVKERMSHGK